MRFKGMRFSSPTREEMEERFNTELRSRVTARIAEITNGGGIYKLLEYQGEKGEPIRAEEKLKLLDEWHKKGIPTRFNTESFQDLLIKKYFPKTD
jgi:hypothetical protein